MTAKRVFRTRRARLLAAVATMLLVPCSAFGFWTGIGGGSASGDSAGSSLEVTLSAGTPGGGLYPGGQTDVALEIANPNPNGVRVGSLSLDMGHGTDGFDVDGAHSGCAVSALAFTTQSNSGAGWSVPPKVGATDGSLDVDLSDALAMSTSAADACQGASFTVYLETGP